LFMVPLHPRVAMRAWGDGFLCEGPL